MVWSNFCPKKHWSEMCIEFFDKYQKQIGSKSHTLFLGLTTSKCIGLILCHFFFQISEYLMSNEQLKDHTENT